MSEDVFTVESILERWAGYKDRPKTDVIREYELAWAYTLLVAIGKKKGEAAEILGYRQPYLHKLQMRNIPISMRSLARKAARGLKQDRGAINTNKPVKVPSTRRS